MVNITHRLEEIWDSERILVMEKGRLFWEGTPEEFLGAPRESLGSSGHSMMELVSELQDRGLVPKGDSSSSGKGGRCSMSIEFSRVSFSYHKGTPLEKQALREISLSLLPGEWKAVVGHTGSGKSTLAQLATPFSFLRQDTLRRIPEAMRRWIKKSCVFFVGRWGLFFSIRNSSSLRRLWRRRFPSLPGTGGYPRKSFPAGWWRLWRWWDFPGSSLPGAPSLFRGGRSVGWPSLRCLRGEPDFLVLDEPTTGAGCPGQEGASSPPGRPATPGHGDTSHYP